MQWMNAHDSTMVAVAGRAAEPAWLVPGRRRPPGWRRGRERQTRWHQHGHAALVLAGA
jgi:hypothetical protein